MASDDTRLLVTIEARLKQFENSLAKATSGANRAAGQIEGRFRRMDRTLGGIGSNLFGKFLVPAVAIASLTRLANAIRDTVKEAAKLGDTADKIGITTDRLQELNFQATQTGSSAETMTTALEQFAKRVGDAAQKGGDLAKIFEANGIALKDAEGNLRPLNDLLSDYANLLKGAKSPSDQFVLSTEAFGRGAGADMVLVLRDGADGLKRFADEAQNTGQVIRENLVREAQEIDDKFDKLVGTLATFAQSQVLIFVRDLSQAFQDLKGGMDAVLSVANDAINIGKDQPLPLGQQIDVVTKAIEALKLSIAEAELQNIVPGHWYTELAVLQTALRDLNLQKVFPGKQKDDTFSAPATAGTPTTLPRLGGSSGSSSSRSAATSEIERQKEAVANLIKELQFEQTMISSTAEEQAVLTALREAGTAATDAQAQSIVALVQQNLSLEEAQKRSEAATRSWGESINTIADSLSTLSSVAGKENTKMAMAAKAAAIVEATISVYQGMAKALTLPFPANIAAVAAVAAQGFAFVAQIRAQSLREGGFVRGPGSATSDSIPARLSRGEFVVNARAASANRRLLEAINSDATFNPRMPGPIAQRGAGKLGDMKISIDLTGANGDQAIAFAARQAAMQGAKMALAQVTGHLAEQQRAY